MKMGWWLHQCHQWLDYTYQTTLHVQYLFASQKDKHSQLLQGSSGYAGQNQGPNFSWCRPVWWTDRWLSNQLISQLCPERSGLTYRCTLHTHDSCWVFNTILWDLKCQPLWNYKSAWKLHPSLWLPVRWVGTRSLGRCWKRWECTWKRTLVEWAQGAALMRLEDDCARSTNIEHVPWVFDKASLSIQWVWSYTQHSTSSVGWGPVCYRQWAGWTL